MNNWLTIPTDRKPSNSGRLVWMIAATVLLLLISVGLLEGWLGQPMPSR